MFDERRVALILDLHEKSYALLRWVKAALKEGRLSFSVVHDATDSETAAREWIQRHLPNIPADMRPDQADIPAFARLFVSFLKTSFQLNPNATRVVSPCGCWCSFCTYLQAGPNLDPKTPSKKDMGMARELKRIYVTRLASEAAPGLPPETIETILGRRDLRERVAMATWGAEMLRRSEFASQGEAVLALWREFAWENGRPKRRYKLTARTICEAERHIRDALVALK
jgi:hypothetical protein